MVDFYRKNIIQAGWILAILIIGMMSGNIVGQGERNTVVLYVHISNGLASYGEIFIDSFRQELTKNDIELTLINDLSQSNVSIGFLTHPREENGILLNIKAHTPTQLELSPILYAQHDQPFLGGYLQEGDEVRADFARQTLIGLSLYSINRCDLALPYLNKANQIYEGEPFVSFYQATCELLAGNYREAAEIYNKSWYLVGVAGVITNPSTINLAWILAQHQDWVLEDDVVWYLPSADCLRFFEWRCPVQSRIDQLQRLAQVYALGFDYQKALETIDEAINLSTTSAGNAELYTIRGQIHLLLYEWENARADFNQAIELDDEYADAYFYRGVLHSTLIERDNALSDFEQYLVLAPDGRYAEETARYMDSIKIEIEASGD